MHSVAEGLVQREDGNGIKLIIDCCPPEVIKDAVEEMTRNGLKGEDLANEFIGKNLKYPSDKFFYPKLRPILKFYDQISKI